MGLPTTTAIGNIQKIETRQTPTGKNVTKISLSCGQKNSKGEWDNLYIDGTFWEKQSDFVSQYFKEGDAIEITGKLVTTNYTNSSGVKVYKTEFLFPQASFLPKSKNDTNVNTAPPQNQQQSYQQPPQQQNEPQPMQGYGQPQQTAQNGNVGQNQQGAIPTININEDAIPFNCMAGNLYV